MIVPSLSVEEIERKLLRRIFWYKFWRRLAFWTTVLAVVGAAILLPWLAFLVTSSQP